MFKNSPYICHTFSAIDDVIVTSVNTYTSMMGISTEDNYFVKSLRANKKYGAKRLLKCFLTCADGARSTTTQYVQQQYL